jgi:glutamate carboxypeptidase
MYQHHLDWILQQQELMIALVEEWAAINSGSTHARGIAAMIASLKDSFSSLGGSMSEISLKPLRSITLQGQKEVHLGTALHIKKHPNAAIQVFLGGHLDTVFPPESPFQKTERKSNNTLHGPGVADMKGGLVILLKTLEAFERSPFAGAIGWEVLINPDEEIGSPGSTPLFGPIAKRNHLGLIFEPAFPDGALVSKRKGSANITVVAKGRSAHAGRDFFEGRNALTALARFLLRAELLTDKGKGITVNVGQMHGGHAANVVPDEALGILNLRTERAEDLTSTLQQLHDFAEEESGAEGLQLNLEIDSCTPPKLFDASHQLLFQAYRDCAKELDIPLLCRPSGGVCDGSRLQAEGLPNLDTLGAVGGHIHTTSEYIDTSSLVQRTLLSTLFLFRLAKGDFAVPPKEAQDG